MTKFAEIQDGARFVWGEFLYMKIPEVKTPIGACASCGVGINALTIGRRNGDQLTDGDGYPILPWGVHFCPEEQVEAR